MPTGDKVRRHWHQRGPEKSGLCHIGIGGGAAAVASPVGVEEFAAWLIDTLIGVCAEVVALCLEEVGGEALCAVAVKVAERRGDAGHGHADLDGGDGDVAPGAQ